jgi:hypothetical protein
MSRTTRFVAAGACLVFAVLLLLFAADARRWGKHMAADDLRFAANPLPANLWRPAEVLPFGVARGVLGIDDDLQYRRAVKLFRLGRPRETLSGKLPAALRAQSQIALTEASETGTDRKRRSQAANLLGILSFSLAVRDPSLATTFLQNAVANFRHAMELDETNEDARFNLEYALFQLKGGDEDSPRGKDRPGDPRGTAGLSKPGRGY